MGPTMNLSTPCGTSSAPNTNNFSAKATPAKDFSPPATSLGVAAFPCKKPDALPALRPRNAALWRLARAKSLEDPLWAAARIFEKLSRMQQYEGQKPWKVAQAGLSVVEAWWRRQQKMDLEQKRTTRTLMRKLSCSLISIWLRKKRRSNMGISTSHLVGNTLPVAMGPWWEHLNLRNLLRLLMPSTSRRIPSRRLMAPGLAKSAPFWTPPPISAATLVTLTVPTLPSRILSLNACRHWTPARATSPALSRVMKSAIPKPKTKNPVLNPSCPSKTRAKTKFRNRWDGFVTSAATSWRANGGRVLDVGLWNDYLDTWEKGPQIQVFA